MRVPLFTYSLVAEVIFLLIALGLTASITSSFAYLSEHADEFSIQRDVYGRRRIIHQGKSRYSSSSSYRYTPTSTRSRTAAISTIRTTEGGSTTRTSYYLASYSPTPATYSLSSTFASATARATSGSVSASASNVKRQTAQTMPAEEEGGARHEAQTQSAAREPVRVQHRLRKRARFPDTIDQWTTWNRAILALSALLLAAIAIRLLSIVLFSLFFFLACRQDASQRATSYSKTFLLATIANVVLLAIIGIALFAVAAVFYDIEGAIVICDVVFWAAAAVAGIVTVILLSRERRTQEHNVGKYAHRDDVEGSKEGHDAAFADAPSPPPAAATGQAQDGARFVAVSDGQGGTTVVPVHPS